MAGITPKQEAFARGIISGLNPSEAYKQAGYKAGNPATVATEAQRLMNNPHIAPIIRQGRQAAMTNAVWSRTIALERVQAVNDSLYRKITEEGEMSRDTLRAFLDSTAMLNDLSDVEHEKELRREIVEEETREVREGGFDFSELEGTVVREAKSRREALEMFVAS